MHKNDTSILKGVLFHTKIDRPDVAKLRARRGSDPRKQSAAGRRFYETGISAKF